jgi:hypothetical protein
MSSTFSIKSEMSQKFTKDSKLGTIFILRKGKRVGPVGGIAKYLLFLTGVGGWF